MLVWRVLPTRRLQREFIAVNSLWNISSGCGTSSKPHFQHAQVTRQLFGGSRRLSTNSNGKWSLNDLSKVSETSSPLIVHSSSTNPYHNLAIEHFLLTASDPSSRILFFYTNRPCVVIGRNQNPWLECDLKKLQEGNLSDNEGLESGTHHVQKEKQNNPIDLVRRRSGGGTVFHDSGNLNYSVIVPNDKAFERRKHAEMVVRALNSMPAYDFGEVTVNNRNDIVMLRDSEWLKISGSAFKLTRGRALHHGTLLYSSPNLHQISSLLRSPGRGLIQAKGVESVRSKVGNLNWLNDQSEREGLRKAIVAAVVDEFWKMYGSGPQHDPNVEIEVGDPDCQPDVNPSIDKGVKEITTQDWRFGQTPRFDFTSGVIDGQEVEFFAHHGILEQVKIYNGINRANGPQASFSFDEPPKIHEVDDWNATLKAGVEETASNIQLSNALLQRISSIFPVYPL